MLEQHGYLFKRSRGSHRIYYNPISKKTISVPFHGGRDMPLGTFLSILRQAGIDRKLLR
ncbi:MAG: type II toxin-antitoxin system HicA family toxin [Saprospiraceae bacterium]